MTFRAFRSGIRLEFDPSLLLFLILRTWETSFPSTSYASLLDPHKQLATFKKYCRGEFPSTEEEQAFLTTMEALEHIPYALLTWELRQFCKDMEAKLHDSIYEYRFNPHKLNMLRSIWIC